MKIYILDENNIPFLCEDTEKWGKWFESANRHVARTVIDHITISTVFLGIDHQWDAGPPLLFETMVFGGEFDGEQERYSSYTDASIGHSKMVIKVCEK